MECNSNYRILNNQVKIPCAAFGTYKAAEGNSADIIGTAIRAGYRHFDTASVYGTEKYVAEAIEKSRIPRQEFFLTSKVWKEDMGYEQTKAAFAKTLEQLNTDYLDLYLIDLQIRFRFPKIHNPTDGHQNLPHIEVLHDR